jgi:hypothetical protein
MPLFRWANRIYPGTSGLRSGLRDNSRARQAEFGRQDVAGFRAGTWTGRSDATCYARFATTATDPAPGLG